MSFFTPSPMYTTYYPTPGKYEDLCLACGAQVGDRQNHNLWHRNIWEEHTNLQQEVERLRKDLEGFETTYVVSELRGIVDDLS